MKVALARLGIPDRLVPILDEAAPPFIEARAVRKIEALRRRGRRQAKSEEGRDLRGQNEKTGNRQAGL